MSSVRTTYFYLKCHNNNLSDFCQSFDTQKCASCKVSSHGIFLEWRNTTKSLSNIWQYFSCLLDEGIPKICMKLNSHDGFLSYLQNSTANSAHLAAHFCPALVCPQKVTAHSKNWEFNFFHIFGIPSSSRHEKCCQMLERPL